MKTKRVWLIMFLLFALLLIPTATVQAQAATADATVASAANAKATVTVAHFAPFVKSVDDTAVTVRINGKDALTNFKFGDVAKNVELAPGTYKVEILPSGTNTVAIQGTLKVRGGQDYTVAAIGNGGNQPLELFTFWDFNAPLPNFAKVRIAHLAPFAADVAATKVDLCTDAGQVVLSDVAYKTFTNPFLVLPAGDYDLKIAVAGSKCATVALDLPVLKLVKGQVAEVYAIGDIDNQPLQLAATTDLTSNPPPAPATVTVAHFAPFAKNVDDTAVTVRINGKDALTNFKFGDKAANVALAAGKYLVEVLPSGTQTVAISGTFDLAAGVDYTVAAIGNGNKQPLELLALADDNTPLPDSAKVRIAHLAPFAADLAATKVDICTDDGQVVVPDLAYKEVTTPYLTLPAGDYNLKIAVAGSKCATVALDLPSVRLAKGDVAEVYAIGDIDNQPLQLAATTDLTLTPAPAPATVTVAHFAPFAESLAATAVTVRINGKDALTNFKFGQTADNIPLPAGNYKVEILPSGTQTVAISGTFDLKPGVDYTVAAIGNVSNQPLELLALVDDRKPLTDSAKLRIAHLAPFSNTLEATKVDICTDEGAVVLGGVPYKGVTDPYLTLPPGDYDLKITLAGSNCQATALNLPSVRLAKGDVAEVYAIGDIENQPLQLAATTPLKLTPAQSQITIAVDAMPDSVRNFRFTGDLGHFRLDDANPQDDDSVGSQRTFSVAAGTYTLAEQEPYRWILSDIQCTGGQTSVDLDQKAVTITVGTNDDVTCTFVNQRHAFIKTRVYNDRDGNGARTFEPSLNGWKILLYDAQGKLLEDEESSGYGKANFNHLRPGQYTVCQETQSGWTNTQPATLDASLGNLPCYTFEAKPKETVTLFFGNINQVGVAVAAQAAAQSGIVTAEDAYVDHNNARYLLEGAFVDEDAQTPDVVNGLFLPFVVNR